MAGCDSLPYTTSFHADLTQNIAGNPVYSPGYATLSGGGKNKVVKGAIHQKRPSASHYYKVLNKPVDYKISYRPRKGGKYILHSLQLRKNGIAYWKAEESLPKLSKKRTRVNKKSKVNKKRKTNKSRRKTRKRRTRKR